MAKKLSYFTKPPLVEEVRIEETFDMDDFLLYEKSMFPNMIRDIKDKVMGRRGPEVMSKALFDYVKLIDKTSKGPATSRTSNGSIKVNTKSRHAVSIANLYHLPPRKFIEFLNKSLKQQGFTDYIVESLDEDIFMMNEAVAPMVNDAKRVFCTTNIKEKQALVSTMVDEYAEEHMKGSLKAHVENMADPETLNKVAYNLMFRSNEPLINCGLAEEILYEMPTVSDSDMREVLTDLSRKWAAKGVNFDFSKHFKERVNDARNSNQPISVDDLKTFFDKIYEKMGTKIGKIRMRPGEDMEGVFSFRAKSLHVPFVIRYEKDNGKGLVLLAQSIIRKKKFALGRMGGKHFVVEDFDNGITMQLGNTDKITEDHGAGFMGTSDLTKKYMNATPGQDENGEWKIAYNDYEEEWAEFDGNPGVHTDNKEKKKMTMKTLKQKITEANVRGRSPRSVGLKVGADGVLDGGTVRPVSKTRTRGNMGRKNDPARSKKVDDGSTRTQVNRAAKSNPRQPRVNSTAKGGQPTDSVQSRTSRSNNTTVAKARERIARRQERQAASKARSAGVKLKPTTGGRDSPETNNTATKPQAGPARNPRFRQVGQKTNPRAATAPSTVRTRGNIGRKTDPARAVGKPTTGRDSPETNNTATKPKVSRQQAQKRNGATAKTTTKLAQATSVGSNSKRPDRARPGATAKTTTKLAQATMVGSNSRRTGAQGQGNQVNRARKAGDQHPPSVGVAKKPGDQHPVNKPSIANAPKPRSKPAVPKPAVAKRTTTISKQKPKSGGQTTYKANYKGGQGQKAVSLSRINQNTRTRAPKDRVR